MSKSLFNFTLIGVRYISGQNMTFAIRVGESGSIADNLTIEYQRVALHIGRANTQEIMIPSMPEQYRYSLPVKAGDQRQLGELTGAACATLVAEMAERHGGPVVLIAPDMQNALRLNDEIRQFTDSMVAGLADWETLPYDSFSPHQDIISSRLATLYQLPTMERGVLIIPVSTLMQRVCPHNFLHGHALVMKKGQRLSRDALRAQLDSAGYRHVDQVMEHGEYATRGALLDLFPMGSEQPYRLDFFDDEIDSLRLFDVDSQRTLEEVASINLLPAHEFPTDQAAIELFRSQWRDRFEVKRDAEHIYQQVSKGTLPAGIEYWQPLFFNEPLPPLFSYFPEKTLIVNTGDLEASAERFQNETRARFENRGVDPMRPLLPPEQLWLRSDELFSELKKWPRVQLKTERLAEKAANTNLGYQKLHELAIQAQNKAPLDNLRRFLESFSGPVIFSVESEGRREALGEMLARIKIAPKHILRLEEATANGRYLMIGAAEHGFIDSQRNLALICESDLLGERVARRRQDSRRTINPDTLIRNLAELHIGQPVVHLEHGVGRYAGMTTLEAGGINGEYLMLTYANDAKLYVPVSSLHLISRYAGGAEENAPLHKLGGDAWARARQKAAEKVRDVAAELLDIYAQRAAKAGYAFKHDKEQYQLFCAICASRWRWTAWCAATLASARRKWRCAPRFWRWKTISRWRCWCLPPSSPSSTSITSAIASPTGRCALRCYRAFGALKSRRRSLSRSRRGKSIFLSAPISCCSRTLSCAISAC